MKLKVNNSKSKVAKFNQVKFLGVTILKIKGIAYIAIAKESLARARLKVKELTPRGTHLSLSQSISEFNSWFRGWANYFQITAFPAQFQSIEARARRRFRSRLISQTKRKRFLFKALKKHGVSHKTAAKTAFSNHKRWALSRSNPVQTLFSNAFFEDKGLWIHSKKNLPHWFHVKYWVHLP